MHNLELYGKLVTRKRYDKIFSESWFDNMEQKIRVLLADGDSEFCARMAAALEQTEDMELVGIAEDGGKALTAVQELRPDVLLIDLVLPVMDGRCV